MPKLSRMAVLRDLTELGNPRAVQETERSALGLRVQRYYMEVRGAYTIESAFRGAGIRLPDALLVSSAIFNSNRQQIVKLAAKNRLPAMYPRQNSWMREDS